MKRLVLPLCALLAACSSSDATDAATPQDASNSDVSANDVTASDVTASDVTASDVTASDATASDASASDAAPTDASTGTFTLTSSAFVDHGTLPAEYTCDGVGHSPPLAWSGVPAGTTEFAVMMTTLARDGLKWNWVLHSIPGATRALAVASTGVGVAGITSDGPALTYSPPCSQGPGAMMYTYTVYALSAHPTLPTRARDVTGAVLTDAIRAITLASASATVTYTR